MTVRWRHVLTRANGHVGAGCCARDACRSRFVASVLDVLTLDGPRIAGVTGFATAEVFPRLGRPGAPLVSSEVFRRFGLPDLLPADTGVEGDR